MDDLLRHVRGPPFTLSKHDLIDALAIIPDVNIDLLLASPAKIKEMLGVRVVAHLAKQLANFVLKVTPVRDFG